MMRFAVLLLLVAAAYARDDNRSPKTNGNAEKPRRPATSTLDFCQECKDVVVQVRTILDDPSKFAQLETDLRVMCAAMGPYADMCRNVVDNLPFLIHQIRPLLTNETSVCMDLDLCGTTTSNTGAKKLAILLIRKHLNEVVPSSAQSRPSNDMVCEECIFAMTELRSLLQDKAIQNQIKQFLNNVCTKLGSMSQECTELLDEYLPLVYSELIALLENARQVCTDAGLCTGSGAARGSTFGTLIARLARLRGSQPSRNREQMSVHSEATSFDIRSLELMLLKGRTKGQFSVGCTMCEVTMRKLKQFLMNDESAQIDAINTVKKLCNKMPEEVKVQCVDFLDVYGKAALIVMIDQMDPVKICRKLGACDSRESKRLQRLWKMSPEARSEVECEACRIFFNILHMELQDPQVQTEVTQMAKRMCQMAPAAYVTECNEAVDAFIPAMLANLSQLTGDTVCPAINMCPAEGADVDETVIELRV